MLSALLLAGVCSAAPLFDMTGPVCSPADQALECRCSECFSWAPLFGDPQGWYEVVRTDPDNSTRIVGSTLWRNHAAYPDEDYELVPAIVAHVWCVAWDEPFPEEGSTYTYKVRGCFLSGCGSLTGEIVSYTAAPYACYAGAGEVPCFPGAPMLNP